MTAKDHRIAVWSAGSAAGIAAAVLLLPYSWVAWVLPVLRTVGLIAVVFGLVCGIMAALVIAYGPVTDELKFTALTDPKHRTTDDPRWDRT